MTTAGGKEVKFGYNAKFFSFLYFELDEELAKPGEGNENYTLYLKNLIDKIYKILDDGDW